MLRRVSFAFLLAGLLVGCIEQESDEPSAADRKAIQAHILKTVPNIKYKVDADLEGKATYLGIDVDKATIKPGEQFTLTHYWKVSQNLEGWRLFVHLNGEGGKGYVNADHKPVVGRYPVRNWKAGEIIRDVHKVTLPRNWASSKVSVFVGLWQGKKRLKPSKNSDGQNRVLAVTLPVVGAAKPAPRKRLVAAKTTKPVKVDGKLDDEVWAKAPSSGAFVNTMNGSKSPVHTDVKVAWDDKFVYFGFTAQDDDIWSSLKKRDDKLYTQEVVEIFIDANRDGKDYVELQVNPNGAIFDSYLPRYRANQNDWNSKMKAAVVVDGTVNKRDDKDKSWTVEIAVPWADVKGLGKYEMAFPPKVGTSWRVNFFRLDAPKDKPPIAAGWSPPLVGDFHKIDRFGDLVFGDEAGKAPEGKTAAVVSPALQGRLVGKRTVQAMRSVRTPAKPVVKDEKK